MKVKSGFLLRDMGGQPVVVSVGAASKIFNGMVKLNASGKLLWEKLQNDVTEQELINALIEKYGIEEELARTDVNAFLETLRKPGIIE